MLATEPFIETATAVAAERQRAGLYRRKVVQVKIESLDEAVSYALSLGTSAEVISPRKVREALSTAARAIAEMYGTK